ncbi:parathyroid hormone-like [Corythoichthys intestinalis]|uniref:parathyroid hormone-like n=1 Tax=Corythoichthys intestinalis TaxID=161448 RepID=UPI0025A5BE29|nr:parathyroid hormone-like [Corythoichthys intestinalis]
MRRFQRQVLFISLCILDLSVVTEGRPLRKRTVSEVQLMHNLGEHKQMQERRDWLQLRLQGILTAPGHSRWETGRSSRRLIPDELPEFAGMTTEELQEALKIFEKLLNSKYS